MNTPLTAEAIYEIANEKSDTVRGQIIIINRLFRKQDDSHLWPINGRFSVVERAIRQARKFQNLSGCSFSPLEYAMFIEQAESEIVNNTKNW